jgi:membrane peptidoglycan carboxypeptidase
VTNDAHPARRSALPRRKQMGWGLLAAVLVSAGLLGAAYATTSIPTPNAAATQQLTTIYAADHKTVIARIGTDRVDVPLSEIPLQLQHAVLAAEDRHFFSEPAVSATGTLRALYEDLRGADITQGGSTITQQYVKNAYLTQQRTLTRKLDEILIAIKLGQTTSKSQILDDYLNTVYFGRNAYGVDAAAKAYFGKPLSELTVSEDAVLAEVIQAPSVLDPRVSPSAAAARWQYVVNGMVSQGWLPAAQASAMHLPHTVVPHSAPGCQGNDCFIAQAAMDELGQMGFTQQQLDQGGYKIYTTIQPQAQAAAETAINTAIGSGELNERTGKPETSLVSIKPGDGAIEAMYSGPGCHSHSKSTTRCVDTTGISNLFDPNTTGYGRPPGSSMKPYTLIAALQQGMSLDQIESGPSVISVGGAQVHNAGGEVCSSPCTLTTALAESINTVFVPLAAQIGPDKVADVAHAAGIPKSVKLPDVPEITLGTEDVPVVDQADGYATIAAGGEQAAPYLVSQVVDPQGDVVGRTKPKLTRAFSPTIAADATYAMQQVLNCTPIQGTACGKQLTGRPAAGKTGTATNKGGDNSDAWFIGFTPQLSTAVWVGNDIHGSTLSPGGLELYGGETPAGIWQSMMNSALTNVPVVPFSPPSVTVPTAPALTSSSALPYTSPPATSTTSTPVPSSSTPSSSPRPTTPTTRASTPPPTVTKSSTPTPPPAGGSGGATSPAARPGFAFRLP